MAKLFICVLFRITHWLIAADALLSGPGGSCSGIYSPVHEAASGTGLSVADKEQQYAGTGYSPGCVPAAVHWRVQTEGHLYCLICSSGTYVMRVPASCSFHSTCLLSLSPPPFPSFLHPCIHPQILAGCLQCPRLHEGTGESSGEENRHRDRGVDYKQINTDRLSYPKS